MSLPLGIGTTEDFFHSLGTSPSCIDLLNKIITPLAIAGAVFLSMIAEISSGPFAFVVSRESSSSRISSSVHKSSEGQSEEVVENNS